MTEKEEMSICMREIGCEPDVKGYRLLIKAPKIPDKSSGGIIYVDQYKKENRRYQNVGLVLKIGPTAFQDRFEDRRCKEGDWIHYSSYEREEVYPYDELCYYINDEKIYAVLKEEDVPIFIKAMR